MHIVDTHLHLWDPARLHYDWLDGALNARFGPDELAEALTAVPHEVSFVFVQAECAPEESLAEVAWVSELAEHLPIRGIVARVALNEGERTDAALDALADYPLVRGVRHLLQSEPVGTATAPAFVAGARALAARGLTFDACVRGSEQLRDVAALAAAVPELAIVLDHLGKPEVGTSGAPLAPSDTWLADLDAVARHPNVWCKLSGLPAEAGGDWSDAQVTPFLDAALAAFGPERLMFGSDWPVSAERGGQIDAGAYAKWAACVTTWANARDPLGGEQQGALGARSFYRLD